MLKINFLPQVFPIRVKTFNEFKLPISAPVFQPFLAVQSGIDIACLFIVDQGMHPVPLREALDCIVTVFVNPAYEVICHANIQGAVAFIRHDIYIVCLVVPSHGEIIIGGSGLPGQAWQ
jgi:hypothetical protein